MNTCPWAKHFSFMDNTQQLQVAPYSAVPERCIYNVEISKYFQKLSTTAQLDIFRTLQFCNIFKLTKMKSFLQLFAVAAVFLHSLSVGNPIERNYGLYDFCSCESERHIIRIFHQDVTQHSCVLKIQGSGSNVRALEAASDCCCIATFEVEKVEEYEYYTRVPSDGCELVSCGTL